jgi:hypothetical protein
MSALRMMAPQPSIISRLVSLANDQELHPTARRAIAAVFFDHRIPPERVDVTLFVPLLFTTLDCLRGTAHPAEVERIAARALGVVTLSTPEP